MTEDTSSIWIYHEKQEALLCGQHALNNLLQRPAFTAFQLSQIAHQLDALELEYMAQNNEGGTKSADYLRRVQEGSSNVDERGNFSIQVRVNSRVRVGLPLLLLALVSPFSFSSIAARC